MAAFDAAGIYAFIDLDTFNSTVVETSPQWTQPQFQAYAMVMDTFSKYDNVAGFYIVSMTGHGICKIRTDSI